MAQIAEKDSPMCIHCLKQIRKCDCTLEGWPGVLRAEVRRSHQAGCEAVSAGFDLLSGKLTRIAASLLKERLADFAEDYPKRFPKHVLRDIERHNERIRVLACELIDLKRAI